MNDAEKFLKELSKSIREQARQFNAYKQLEGTSFEIYHALQMEQYMRRESMERDAYIALSNVMSDYGELIDPDKFRDLFNTAIMLNSKGIDTPDKVYELLNRCEKEGIL